MPEARKSPEKPPPDVRGPKPGGPGPQRPGFERFRSPLLWALVVILALFLFQSFLQDRNVKQVQWGDFVQAVEDGRFSKVVFSDGWAKGFLKEDDKAQKTDDNGFPVPSQPWQATRPAGDELLPTILKQRKQASPDGFDYDYRQESTFGTLFWVWVVPIVLVVLLWSFFMRRMSAGMGQGPQGLMAFGKSKARVHLEPDTGVTFSDVAGIEEAVEELQEIVEFLSKPEKYRRLGGKIPKGVLLVGPPGTGKTLLARAVAGEAQVPFLSLSGSEFVEMFVGVGAARVRDLFQTAQAKAPAIIFIDELDALAKARSSGNMMGGHDEREQTLNQLLSEMDGFDPRVGLIVLAATNRPEILDQALLRPGRFDRQVLVDRPDKRGRAHILRIHVKDVKLSPQVDLEEIATHTPGFAGADLANVVNEAALLAARRNADAVEMQDFHEAIERVVAGLRKKNRRMNDDEKKIVAYHESGHALVGLSLPHSDPVHKVSIIPHGLGALGYTMQLPLEDRYLMREDELRDKMAGLLGGRAAEEVVFGSVSTGASDDLRKCTQIARAMVTEYGMSENVGALGLGGQRSRFLGNDDQPMLGEKSYSDRTSELIDAEVKRLVDEALHRARQVIRDRRDVLEKIAAHLLEYEVIEKDQLEQIAGPPVRRPTVGRDAPGEGAGESESEQKPPSGPAPEDGQERNNGNGHSQWRSA